MPDSFVLMPEVAGGLGDGTVIDRSTTPPIVSRLHYVMEGWLGDDLLETFPCYIVTERLGNALRSQSLSGIAFGSVQVSKSQQFEDLYPNRQLPKFFWLKVTGNAGRDDFGLSADFNLVVSDHALGILRRFNLSNCEIERFLPTG
jgi:hypothetical protein